MEENAKNAAEVICPSCYVKLPPKCTPAGLASHQRGKECLRRVSRDLRNRAIAKKRKRKPPRAKIYARRLAQTVDDVEVEIVPVVSDYTRMMLMDYTTASSLHCSQQNLLSTRVADLVNLASQLDARRVVLLNEEGEEVGEYDLVNSNPSTAQDAGRSTEQIDANNQTLQLVSAVMGLITPTSASAGLPASARSELFKIVDLALSVGWTSTDVNARDVSNCPKISELMQYVSGQSEDCYDMDLSAKSISSERAYLALLDSLSQADGWERTEVSAGDGLATAVLHWNSRAMEQVTEKAKEFWAVLKTKPETTNSEKHKYHHPMTGQFAQMFAALIQKQRKAYRDHKESDFVLLLSFFSDATLLANKGSMSAHPLIVTIANLPEEHQRESIVKIGYFAMFRGPRQTSEEQQRQLKRALFAKQLDIMLEPFRRASYVGVEIEVNDGGDKVRFFPAFFDTPIDNPEVCSILQHKSSYCGLCYWKAGLGLSTRRTEARSRAYLAMMKRSMTSNSLKALQKLTGAHPQQSGAWGFNGSCPFESLPHWIAEEYPRLYAALRRAGSSTVVCDVHLSVTTEAMHEIDLGLVVYFKDAVYCALKHDLKSTKTKVEIVNDQLEQCLTVESRWQGLMLPPVKKETAGLKGYWGGSSRVEAAEHRAVLQVVVAVLYRALGKTHRICMAAILFVKYYRVRMRRFDIEPGGRYHTEGTLEETNRLFYKVKEMLDTLGHHTADSLQSSDSEDDNEEEKEGKPKMHAQLHFTELVRRNGFSTMLTGELGENHNAKIKAPYKGGRTNRQTSVVTQQLVKHDRAVQVSQALQRSSFVSLPPDLPQRKYDTVAYLAIEADACKLTKYTCLRTGNRISLVDIATWSETRPGSHYNPLQLETFDRTKTHAADRLMCGKPRLKNNENLSKEGRQCHSLFGHPRVAEEFVRELQWQFGVPKDGDFADSPALRSARFRYTSNAVVPAAVRGQKRNTRYRLLQSLRAHNDFHGSPWFDFVAITSDTPHMGDDLFYARLVFFFHFPLPNGSRLELAFVRWCSRVDMKTNEGGEVLGDDEPDIFELHYTAYTRETESTDRWLFGIIRAESIIRKVHVVAGNDAASRSLLNPYPSEITQADIDDANATFLVNGYVWEKGGKEPYVISGDRLREFS